MNTSKQPGMLRPPINRALKQLDRSLFLKTIPLSVAKIPDFKQITKVKKELEKDAFYVPRKQHVMLLSQEDGSREKGILLRPEIKADDGLTWSPTVSDLVKSNLIEVVPHSLKLDYDYWDYHEIMCSILPEEEGENIPGSYATVGHIAHINLREEFLPYKYIIAQVILDKVGYIKTVINKIENVGSNDEFRTFEYEVLAGPDDMNVVLKEAGCIFSFDYSKVYWNSRLNTEHERVVSLFQPGQAICDVMAGVGPFAGPAGRKKCWVLANDLNPHCHIALQDTIKQNKIQEFVQAFNEDGTSFIRTATDRLLHEEAKVDVTPPAPRRLDKKVRKTYHPREFIHRPLVFSHYVLNLPATAINFLPSFIGVYAGHENLFEPITEQKLPMVHVYCFSKQDDDDEARREISHAIGAQLSFEMSPAKEGEDGEGKVQVVDVRLVAPKKRYFCASFRLPREVAFRQA